MPARRRYWEGWGERHWGDWESGRGSPRQGSPLPRRRDVRAARRRGRGAVTSRSRAGRAGAALSPLSPRPRCGPGGTWPRAAAWPPPPCPRGAPENASSSGPTTCAPSAVRTGLGPEGSRAQLGLEPGPEGSWAWNETSGEPGRDGRRRGAAPGLGPEGRRGLARGVEGSGPGRDEERWRGEGSRAPLGVVEGGSWLRLEPGWGVECGPVWEWGNESWSAKEEPGPRGSARLELGCV